MRAGFFHLGIGGAERRRTAAETPSGDQRKPSTKTMPAMLLTLNGVPVTSNSVR